MGHALIGIYCRESQEEKSIGYELFFWILISEAQVLSGKGNYDLLILFVFSK